MSMSKLENSADSVDVSNQSGGGRARTRQRGLLARLGAGLRRAGDAAPSCAPGRAVRRLSAASRAAARESALPAPGGLASRRDGTPATGRRTALPWALALRGMLRRGRTRVLGTLALALPLLVLAAGQARRLSCRTRWAAGLLWACLVPALAGLVASPAHAQTTLVSNIGQTSSTGSMSIGLNNSGVETRYAAKFKTGDNDNGYTLSAADVEFRSGFGGNDAVRVSIYTEATSTDPDSSLQVLTNPISIVADGVNTFTAPAGTTLQKDTKYFVFVESTAGDGFTLQPTNENGEDAGGATGWNINNTTHLWKSDTMSWSITASNMKIAIKGMANTISTDATLSGLTLQYGGSDVTLDPVFASDEDEYTAEVAPYHPGVVTVEGTPTHDGASVAYLAGNVVLTDADGDTDGFQVALAEGENTITVKVTAEDTTTTEDYTLTVTRPMGRVCTAPDIGDRGEVWRGTVTVEQLSSGALSSWGYHEDLGGGLSDTSFEFNSGTYTINVYTAKYPGRQDLVMNITKTAGTPVGPDLADQRVELEPLSLHSCGTVLEFSGTDLAPLGDVGRIWKDTSTSGPHNWSDAKSIALALSRETTPPAPESGVVAAAGTQILLTFDEDLEVDAHNDVPPASAFTVKADGVAVAVNDVLATSLDEITLILSTVINPGQKIHAGQTVTVSYTKPGSGKVIEDAAGNETASFEDFEVTNNSTVPAPPRQQLRTLELLEEPGGTSVDIPGYFRPGTYPNTIEPQLNYVSEVSQQTTRVTVLAEPLKGTAAIEYRRRNGTVIEDADTNDDGHQVDLWGYANPITMKVTNTENSITTVTTYTLTVRRLGSPTQQAATGTPVIRGTARVGATLTLDASGIEDANGTYFAEIGWPQHWFGVSWYVDTSTSDNPNVVRIIGSGGKVTLDDSHEGERIYVRVSFRDDLGNPETLVSDRTTAVQPQQLVISGDGVVTGSRCDYVFPAGPHCDGETSARNVGNPLKVHTSAGLNVTSQATFSVTNPTTVTRLDEFGALHRASYVFDITSGGQLRTVAGETYPHVEGPLCKRRTGTEPHRCDAGTIRSWSLDPVYVEVTAATGDGKGGTYRIPVWVLGHPSAVPVSSASDLRCDGNRCYGRKLAPGQELYEPGFTPTYRYGGGAPLQASFEDVPQAHDGKTAFTLRLMLSEPVETHADAFRDDVFQVKGGSVTGAALVGGSDAQWQITVAPDGNDAVSVVLPSTTDCAAAGAVCTGDGRALSEMAAAAVAGPGQTPAPSPLTAKFTNGPGTHDGTGPFNVFLRFSEAPANVKNIHIKGALQITGGKILRVRVVGGAGNDEAHRRVEIEPAGEGDVRLSLVPTTDCAAANALCTADGRKLESLISLSIPGPASAPPLSPPSPLTASFEQVPEEHDGASAFNAYLRFSEAPANVKNIHIKGALTIAGGRILRVRVVGGVNGDEAHRRVEIEPAGDGNVRLSLSPTTDCAATNALCTAAGGKLETGIGVTIPGPVAISVADAKVEEAPGAVLAFNVTLDRARHDEVKVDYATEDGSAAAGDDYTATSGTLTFAAGETAKTVEVEVIDDAHDEGNETMVLRLSNPIGARIEDGEATGTIENTDLMPKAWLARFGRTFAEDVSNMAKDRLTGTPSIGTSLTLAGYSLASGKDFKGLDEPRFEERTVTALDLATRSAFSFGTGTPQGGHVGLWGRASLSSFTGQEQDLSLDGDLRTWFLGADWRSSRSALGAMVSHTQATGGYQGASDGRVEADLTGVFPYGRHALSERVSLWGVAGYGAGALTLTPDGQSSLTTDMDLAMAAGGVRTVLLEAETNGRPELTAVTDILGVRTHSDAVKPDGNGAGSLAAATAEVNRVRMGVEAAWPHLTLAGADVRPSLELGLRRDGGDAETGMGVDVGAGMTWNNPTTGLSANINARMLLTHESDGFEERGIAGSIGWDPRPKTERGFSLRLTHAAGAQATGGMDALLSKTTLEGLARAESAGSPQRLELGLGYGIPVLNGLFMATPELGLGLSETERRYTAGWRLKLRDNGQESLELRLEAVRREPAGIEPSRQGIGLTLSSRW